MKEMGRIASDNQGSNRSVRSHNLLGNWIFANIIAYVLGGLAGAIADLLFFMKTLDNGVTIVGGLTFPAGLLIGLVLSLIFQGLVLRSVLNPGHWIVSSLVGLLIPLVISSASGMLDRWFSNLAFFVGSSIALTFGILIAFGLGISLAQWIILRRQTAHAGSWIMGSLLGWIFGLVLGLAFGVTLGMALAIIVSQFVNGAIGGVIFPCLVVIGIGAGYAWISGITLERLLTISPT